MGRKNHRAHRPQARRDKLGMAARPRPAQTPVEQLVMPTGTCPSRKLRFTADTVELALKQAQQRRAFTKSGRVERRFYGGPDDPCPRGCGGYHLTSRETWEKR